jgi:hypothetical protein
MAAEQVSLQLEDTAPHWQQKSQSNDIARAFVNFANSYTHC